MEGDNVAIQLTEIPQDPEVALAKCIVEEDFQGFEECFEKLTTSNAAVEQGENKALHCIGWAKIVHLIPSKDSILIVSCF